MRSRKQSLLVGILLSLSACSTPSEKQVKVWFLEAPTTRPVRKQEPSDAPEYPLFCVKGDDLQEILK